jgi:hypothetical protein
MLRNPCIIYAIFLLLTMVIQSIVSPGLATVQINLFQLETGSNRALGYPLGALGGLSRSSNNFLLAPPFIVLLSCKN